MSVTKRKRVSDDAPPGRWQRELEVVRGLRDALGLGVDPGIEDAVVALRLAGYRTVMSCAGHLDRRTGGPYVVLESFAAARFARSVRSGSDSDKTQMIFRTAQQIALRELEPLKRLIEAFNERVGRRDQLLELRIVGHSKLRLCFTHSDFDPVDDDIAYARRLKDRRSAMTEFIRYLSRQSL